MALMRQPAPASPVWSRYRPDGVNNWHENERDKQHRIHDDRRTEQNRLIDVEKTGDNAHFSDGTQVSNAAA